MAISEPEPIAMPTSAGGEGRRVVDTVADHGDDLSFALPLADGVGFVLGEGTALCFVDASLCSKGTDGSGLISAEENGAEAELFEAVDCGA